MSLSLCSPAKVNLFLHIHGKRSDGYHELATLLQTVSLADQINLLLSDQDTFTCNFEDIQNNDNLAIRARNLFRLKTGIKEPLAISLTKNIPMQAGLGGGSGNAATVLWGMNRLFGSPASDADLQAWSAELGSDVPFFFSLGTAYCTGRGEIVENVGSLKPQALTLVKPEASLSTQDVYSSFIPGLPKNSRQLLNSFLSENPQYENDLEDAAFAIFPQLRQMKEQLQTQYPHVLLCGSGSSFFCVGKKGSEPHVSYLNRKQGEWYSI